MYVLLDTTNGLAVARHQSYRALACLHYIQFANVDAQIVSAAKNTSYGCLGYDQVVNVLRQCLVQDIPAEYSDQIKLVKTTLETAPWLLLPFTLEELERQAFAIKPDESRPLAFQPGAEAPVLMPRWTNEPQVNRKRIDSAFWINFAAGEPSGQPARDPLPGPASNAKVRTRTTPPDPKNEDNAMATDKSKAPAKKAAKKAVAKAAPKTAPAVKKTAPAKKAAAKKAAPAKAAKATTNADGRETRNGITEPRAGGNTRLVWDTAQALFDKKGEAPTFKDVDAAVEKKNADVPTATRRSTYQVWRKFNGITGRVA